MTNAVLLLDNYADTASVTASTEVPTGPANHVQVQQRTKIWRSQVGNASHLDFEMLAGNPIDYAAVVDVNLPASGTIRVQAWNDAIGGAVPTVDQTVAPLLYVDPSVPISLFGAGNFGAGTFGVRDYRTMNARNVTLIPIAGLPTSKYWRVTFTGGSYQQCGRVYITKAFNFAINPDFGWSASRIENTVIRKSIGGQRFSQPRDNQLQVEGEFGFLTDAERTAALLLLQRFGESRPLIFSFFPEATTVGFTTTMYCCQSGMSLQQVYIDINKLPFRFIEEL